MNPNKRIFFENLHNILNKLLNLGMFLPYFVDILEPMNGIQQLLYLPFNILINEEARRTTF